MKFICFAIAISMTCVLGCNNSSETAEKSGLGVLSSRFEGDEAAMPDFEKGLLLLHSFEYQDAREAFLEAQKIDPGMTMAVWGEAMTYNHPLWGEQDYESGQAALMKLGNTPEEQLSAAANDLERGFVKAIQQLYAPGTDKYERDARYMEAMAGLSEKYPDNGEVSAFYSLATLGSVPEGRDDDIYQRGARIAQGILKENNRHPGALHYLIHSYDDPDHAELALEAADAYAQVAPEASHALHMPSHIYVALGMWDKVVSSNEDSYHASLARKERKALGNDARGYHAYHWLQYGYLQQGRHGEALQMLENMFKYAGEEPSIRARTHVVFLRGTYLVESGDVEFSGYENEFDISDLNVSVRSQFNFQQGYLAYLRNNPDGVNQAADLIMNDYQNEEVLINTPNVTVCSGLSRETASNYDIQQARLMELQLRAIHLAMIGSEEAESRLKEIVSLEEQMSYSYGPPAIQKPSHEIYADWLFSEGRFDESIEMYDRGLGRAPGRISYLKGKAEALEAAGRLEEAKEIRTAIESYQRNERSTELRES